MNTPPAEAGGFGLRLKAGSIGHPADQPPPPQGEGWEAGRQTENTVSRREKEPFFMPVARILLNSICLQVDPPPEGGGLQIHIRGL